VVPGWTQYGVKMLKDIEVWTSPMIMYGPTRLIASGHTDRECSSRARPASSSYHQGGHGCRALSSTTFGRRGQSRAGSPNARRGHCVWRPPWPPESADLRRQWAKLRPKNELGEGLKQAPVFAVAEERKEHLAFPPGRPAQSWCAPSTPGQSSRRAPWRERLGA